MLFTGRALLTGGVYAPVDLPYVTEPLREMREALGVPRPRNGILSDLYAQMIPWRKALQFSYAHGRWPLWNPFILSGTVLAAAAQPAAYSPFTLLACLLPVPAGLTFSAAIAFFLAGLGAYLFARELGCRAACRTRRRRRASWRTSSRGCTATAGRARERRSCRSTRRRWGASSSPRRYMRSFACARARRGSSPRWPRSDCWRAPDGCRWP